MLLLLDKDELHINLWQLVVKCLFAYAKGRDKQVVCNTVTNHNYLNELSFILTIQPLICNLLQAVTIIYLALSTAKHLFFLI